MTESKPKQRIVVVGGGFAGIRTALELAKHAHIFDITLISDRQDFWYYPTMYHTATGGAEAQSSIPISRLLHNKAVTFIEGRAQTLDRTTKTIQLEDKTRIAYDKLVLALGVVTNYFGIPGLEEFSYGIKTIAEAEALKKHLHQQIVDGHQPDLNYIIVGGGATGVELAGNLGEYLHHIMKRHNVRYRRLHIDLVETSKHLMPRMPSSVGKALEKQLHKRGVKLYLGKAVQGQTADSLTVSGNPIRSHTVIWTAGQSNNPFFGANGFSISEHRKVVVDEFLRAEKDIFVIGDNAETPYSGMAQTAVYDADFIAHNFVKEAASDPKLAYRPKKPIYVMPAGPHWAAVEWGKVHLHGWLGWFLREAADFVAFSDIEPLPAATEQWARGLQHQDMCLTCGAAS